MKEYVVYVNYKRLEPMSFRGIPMLSNDKMNDVLHTTSQHNDLLIHLSLITGLKICEKSIALVGLQFACVLYYVFERL